MFGPHGWETMWTLFVYNLTNHNKPTYKDMLNSPVKILHTADLQIEVRGQNQRRDEFEFILKRIEDVVQQEKPNILLWAGDIFEHHRPNDIERGLFIDHLRRVLDMSIIDEIVITDGNHDIDQQTASNFFVSHGNEVHSPNALVTIVEAINSPRIIYMNDSTVYKSKAFDLVYYNWAQRVKHSNVLTEDYNPVNNNLPETTSTPVTIFHDPIRGARMWDDKELRNSEKHNALDVFCTPTILAGDIHIPQVITSDTKTFVYCGSPVPRNFGEGDYVTDGKIKQRGMNRHCISVCLLFPDGTVAEQRFIPIKQHRSFTTFEITPAVTNPVDEIWEIPYPTFENAVKVKLPAATEIYLKWESDIIDAIRKQNPDYENISISFAYGRALTAEADDVISTQDIHQLISEKEIVRVADEYIKKQVNDSRSIPAEDKEKCIKLVTELFSRELKNYISNIPSNHIRLSAISISNFMSFGDKIFVDMAYPQGLIKLTGGNGVGKTTFYNAIKWCTTGYISLAQNRKLKNENNLLIFNDYMWNKDEVVVSCLFCINGEDIVVTRTATRAWKKNTTDEQKKSKNWRNYIQSTDSTITVKNNATGEVKNDIAAEQILQSVFSGLENLSHTVFPSQFTLKSVICTEPARLCEEILRNIGMSFFDKMYDKYDDVRSNIMSKVSKPSSTIEAIASKIADYEKSIEQLTSDKKTIENERTELSKQADDIAAQISEKHLKMDMSVTTDKVNELLNKINDTEVSLTERRKAADELRDNCERFIKLVQWDKLKDVLEAIKAKIDELNNDLNATYSKETELGNKKAEKERQINKRRLEIVEEFSSKRKELTSELNSFHEEINQINEAMKLNLEQRSEYINKVKDKLKQRINDIERSKINQQAVIKELETRSSECNDKIDELKTSQRCPTCGRPFDDETIKHIDEQIQEYFDKGTEYDEQIEKAEELLKQIDADLQLAKNKLEAFTNDPDMLKQVKTYTDDIKKCQEVITNAQKRITEVNERITEIDNSQSAYQDLNIESWEKDINDIVAEIGEVLKSRDSINHILHDTKEEQKNLEESFNEYEDCKQKLDQLKLTYHELDTEATELSRLRDEHTRMVGVIQENQKLKSEIDELSAKATEINTSISEKNSRVVKISTDIAVFGTKIDEERQNKINAIKYRIVEASLKQYKTLIGKNGLPQHIFSIIREVLNSKLNDLLDDMDFRLMFDNSNQLIMVDLSKPGHPIRKPSQLSGMQTCFTGLALVYVNRMCNNTFIFDHIFIDEVSGQLNSGEELTYGSMNYQEQLKKLLRKFSGLKVWIVDHVIDDLKEDYRFEVMPSDTGSSIKLIS